MAEDGTQDRLRKIAKAYDLTVEEHQKGIDPLAKVPVEFRESPEFKRFMEGSHGGSHWSEMKDYLKPTEGMKFLDVGCCANLYNYDHGQWPSIYYGVDISPALIEAMRNYAKSHDIKIGGLEVAEAAALPFGDGSFDIATVLGVLEYWGLPYIERALKELHRVLKPDARAVLDIPNPGHPDTPTMRKQEEYLGRPGVEVTRAGFERVLLLFFTVNRIDDSGAMMAYFVRRKG